MVNTSTAPDLQDRRVDPWCRPKGTTRNLPTGAEPMAAAAGRCAVEQAPHRAVLENEVSRQQVRRGQQRPHELTCPIERRVGHDAKRPVRQHEIAERHLDDCDRRSGESVSQALRPPGVQLDGKDPGSNGDQRCGQRTLACAQVEHEVAGAYRRVVDDAISPVSLEGVPTPGSTGPCPR